MSSLLSTPKPTIVSLVTPPSTPTPAPEKPYVPPTLPALPKPIVIPRPELAAPPLPITAPSVPRIPKPSLPDRIEALRPPVIPSYSSSSSGGGTTAPASKPADITPVTITGDTKTDGSTSPDTAPEAETTDDITTIGNLVRRNRGRLGTVLTSFRGILTPNDLTPYRKTLLGE